MRHIVECRDCRLGQEGLEGPQPGRLPVDGAGVMVIADQPGYRGERLLNALLVEAGVEEGSWATANVTSCSPVNERAPKELEMGACRGHLLAQIQIARPGRVLLVGATALKAFRGDLKLSHVHGHWFRPAEWGGVLTMPVLHPAGVRRDPLIKGELRRDLARFVDKSGYDFGDKCNECIDRAEKWDSDWVPYCAIHYGKQAQKEREKWVRVRMKTRGVKAQGDQGVMW